MARGAGRNSTSAPYCAAGLLVLAVVLLALFSGENSPEDASTLVTRTAANDQNGMSRRFIGKVHEDAKGAVGQGGQELAAHVGHYILRRGEPAPADRHPGREYVRAEDVAGAGRAVRVIGPGDAVTMDYVKERLNINVDADGKITAMHYG